jgi:hypothetical protein
MENGESSTPTSTTPGSSRPRSSRTFRITLGVIAAIAAVVTFALVA